MSNYKRIHNVSQNNHFSKALNAMPEKSKMSVHPNHYTTMNAGDIVPIYCREVLPEEELEISLDFVIRQTTLLTPTMGEMEVTFDAFFVPNRIVNQSWKAVEGENYSGSWTAPKVSLAPLKNNPSSVTVIPVGSVADYYGFPTQRGIPNSLLAKCHDLKFRGYVMIYNEFYRDQNYQPPVPMSTLNVYQGFFDPEGMPASLVGVSRVSRSQKGDGSYEEGGTIVNALVGGDATMSTPNSVDSSVVVPIASAGRRFRAINKPFKANKLHDYFTSVLPSPQRSESPVYASVTGIISGLPLVASDTVHNLGRSLELGFSGGNINGLFPLVGFKEPVGQQAVVGIDNTTPVASNNYVAADGINLEVASTEVTGLSMSVDDIRMAAAIQQVYETLARGGGRYREMVRAFFGTEVEDPYSDIPVRLGRFSRSLDLYQTAQTAPSADGSTPQGNLAAFGYTSSSGHLVKYKALEHGYIHIFAVVRHRNIYGSYFARDNFRRTMLDFYMPQLANISEQGVKVAEINPFSNSFDDDFGYQEAWAEYRFEPDVVSGYMRPGVSNSLSLWNYVDDYDPELIISDGDWLKSNSEEVLNRTLAVTSEVSPQFKCAFRFNVTKVLPMPTYSVPGLDII